MTLPDKPAFDCPNCSAHNWRWNEFSQWGGWGCSECTDVICYLEKI